MIKIILLCTLLLSALSLIVLAVIDLKTRLLPNKFVGAFATLGGIFHIASGFSFAGITDIIAGAIAGIALLLIIRMIANRHYGRDALGLGDVKLMGAAGLWLGLEHIFLAISLGAFAGLLHGLCVFAHMRHIQKDDKVSLSTLSIPAGPGFIIGIVSVAVFKFYPVFSLPVF